MLVVQPSLLICTLCESRGDVWIMFSCTVGKKHRAIVKPHYFATSGQYSPGGGVTWADKATVVWPSCRNQVNVERASVIIAIVIILIFRLIYDYNLIRIKLNDFAKYCLITLVKNRLAPVSPGPSFVCSMSPCRKWLNTQKNGYWMPPSDHIHRRNPFEDQTKRNNWPRQSFS